MILGHRQRAILRYLDARGTVTVEEASTLSAYYHNGNKHAGDVLRNMVKRGLLKRIARGTYARTSHPEAAQPLLTEEFKKYQDHMRQHGQHDPSDCIS